MRRIIKRTKIKYKLLKSKISRFKFNIFDKKKLNEFEKTIFIFYELIESKNYVDIKDLYLLLIELININKIDLIMFSCKNRELEIFLRKSLINNSDEVNKLLYCFKEICRKRIF